MIRLTVSSSLLSSSMRSLSFCTASNMSLSLSVQMPSSYTSAWNQKVAIFLHGRNTYAKGGEARLEAGLGHRKGLVSGMVLEIERIEYLQLGHRGDDRLQSRECFIACADLVRKMSQQTPPTSTTQASERTLREPGRCRRYDELRRQTR